MKNLYMEEFRKIMKVNYDYPSMSASRVEEIMKFARGSNFERIGIPCHTKLKYYINSVLNQCFERSDSLDGNRPWQVSLNTRLFYRKIVFV